MTTDVTKGTRLERPTIHEGSCLATDATFPRLVLHSPLPVVADFGATWCGPWRETAHLVNELALEHEGRLRVVKCDNDDTLLWASRLGIAKLPTFVFFKDGQEVHRIAGPVPDWVLRNEIARFLATRRCSPDATASAGAFRYPRTRTQKQGARSSQRRTKTTRSGRERSG